MGTVYCGIFLPLLLAVGAGILPGCAAAETNPKAGLACSERDVMELVGKAGQSRAASLLRTGKVLEKMTQTIFNLDNPDVPNGMCCCDEVGPVSSSGTGWWKVFNEVAGPGTHSSNYTGYSNVCNPERKFDI